MSTNGNQGGQSIPTGALCIDGQPVSLEVAQHEFYRGYEISTDPEEGEGYSAEAVLPSCSDNQRVLLRSVRQVLIDGRRVTAETQGAEKIHFSNAGPIVIGWSKDLTPKSVGRFGLRRVLGLKS